MGTERIIREGVVVRKKVSFGTSRAQSQLTGSSGVPEAAYYPPCLTTTSNTPAVSCFRHFEELMSYLGEWVHIDGHGIAVYKPPMGGTRLSKIL